MQKSWIWWAVVIIFWEAFFMYTASPLSNNEHTLLILRRLNFLSAQELTWLSKIVRKAAHLLTYGVMAICLRNAMHPHPWTYPAAWFLATLYGAGDEYHQIYVLGRTPLFTDVVIDSLGAAAGLLVAYRWHRVSLGKKGKRALFSRFQNWW